MKKQKAPTWTLIIVLCFGILGFYVGLKCSQVAHNYPEPFTPPLPSLMDIQRRVDCNKIDGIYGEETETLWDRAYANQEADKFMTPSGGPK